MSFRQKQNKPRQRKHPVKNWKGAFGEAKCQCVCLAANRVQIDRETVALAGKLIRLSNIFN